MCVYTKKTILEQFALARNRAKSTDSSRYRADARNCGAQYVWLSISPASPGVTLFLAFTHTPRLFDPHSIQYILYISIYRAKTRTRVEIQPDRLRKRSHSRLCFRNERGHRALIYIQRRTSFLRFAFLDILRAAVVQAARCPRAFVVRARHLLINCCPLLLLLLLRWHIGGGYTRSYGRSWLVFKVVAAAGCASGSCAKNEARNELLFCTARQKFARRT